MCLMHFDQKACQVNVLKFIIIIQVKYMVLKSFFIRHTQSFFIRYNRFHAEISSFINLFDWTNSEGLHDFTELIVYQISKRN